jgi:hypothetical protein
MCKNISEKDLQNFWGVFQLSRTSQIFWRKEERKKIIHKTRPFGSNGYDMIKIFKFREFGV